MYVAGVVVFILILAFIVVLTGAPLAFVDFPSVVVVLGITLTILLASGLSKDLVRGFKIMGQKHNPYTAIELKRTLIALKLTIKTLMFSGLFGSLTGCVAMLALVESISQLVPSFGVALLTLVYAMVFSGVMLPIKFRVEAVLSTLANSDC